MFAASFEIKGGSLTIRYRERERLLGFFLIAIGSLFLPAGLAVLSTIDWMDSPGWVFVGMGSILEAGGLLFVLRSRRLPIGFTIDRSTFCILEKNGDRVAFSVSLFRECGLRSNERRARGPFYLFLRGDCGLDMDLSRYSSKKKAVADLQLLSSLSGIRILPERTSPEETLKQNFALPVLNEQERLTDRAPDLKRIIQRLKDERRLILSPDGRTLRIRDPVARRHSMLSLLFLLFLASMGITFSKEESPLFIAVQVFGILALLASYIMFSMGRTLLFDEGVSVYATGWRKRRFFVLSGSVEDSQQPARRTGERPAAILTFTAQTGVPAFGYFDTSYREFIAHIRLNPVDLAKLAMMRFRAFSHRLYGYTLTESIALYSILREVLRHA